MSGTTFAPFRQVLRNGLTVLHQHNPISSAVTISLSFAGGSSLDPRGAEGTATLMARGLTRGTENRNKTLIGEVLDDRGAHLAGSAGRHSVGLVAKARDVDFAALLELTVECARASTFPEGEVGKLRGDRLTALREDDDDPATVVGKALRELIYPSDHPYARRHRGSVESVEGIDAAALRAFAERQLRPERGVLIVVGGVERETVMKTVVELTEAWGDEAPGAGFRDAVPAIADVAPLTEIRERRIVLADKPQCDIALGFPAIRRRDPRFHAAALMNSILGQFAMGGRLGRSVREEQGMAYYTYSALDASVGPGPFLVRAGVAPAHVQPAVDSILREIARLRSEPVTREELEDARSATIRSLPRTLESNEGMAGLLHRIEMFDLGLDYLDSFAERFEAVTVDDVHAAASELLQGTAYGLAVAGPEASPAPGA